MAGTEQFLIQLVSILTIGGFCCFSASIILWPIKKFMGLRVSSRHEVEGLDIHEHGMDAYADFGLNQH
jgi:Amt family ammonium transporter